MSTLQAATAGATRSVELPEARGPVSERLFDALQGDPASASAIELDELPVGVPLLDDDDVQLALYVAYELHYAHVVGVDERWEWSPALLGLRAQIEDAFEDALLRLVGGGAEADAGDVGGALQRLVADDDGPPLSRFAEVSATREQMLEHVVHRSAYQLKEADPHSWAIPRLCGAAKAALLEIQFDEYGEGRAAQIHAELFAQTMRALGLDATYGAYVATLPGITLATVNVMSLFGLHRRWRGAIVGHLAAFEMTSSIPNRRYANAFRRLGYGADVTGFYDEHVQADAVHENIAAWDLAGGLVRAEPQLAADVLFGARALLAIEARWAERLLDRWHAGESSLLAPLTEG
jgi:hypothetical protein